MFKSALDRNKITKAINIKQKEYDFGVFKIFTNRILSGLFKDETFKDETFKDETFKTKKRNLYKIKN